MNREEMICLLRKHHGKLMNIRVIQSTSWPVGNDEWIVGTCSECKEDMIPCNGYAEDHWRLPKQ